MPRKRQGPERFKVFRFKPVLVAVFDQQVVPPDPCFPPVPFFLGFRKNRIMQQHHFHVAHPPDHGLTAFLFKDLRRMGRFRERNLFQFHGKIPAGIGKEPQVILREEIGSAGR